MLEIDEEKIRELAYQLWQRDGSPEGKDHQYWHAAKELLTDEGDVEPAAEPLIVPPTVALPGAGMK